MLTTFVVETPHGTARVHLHDAEAPRAALVLGHGAGGGVAAPDLVATKDVALEEGFAVALIEQPYRVAGRRSPAPAQQLDTAWRAVIEQLDLDELELITGGRSSGARVACRTAADVGPAGVICLAFPVHPPGRPEKSRLDELDAVTVPVLVVQGARDPFGMPPPGPRRDVVQIRGDHGLKSDLPALHAAVADWLATLVSPGAPVR